MFRKLTNPTHTLVNGTAHPVNRPATAKRPRRFPPLRVITELHWDHVTRTLTIELDPDWCAEDLDRPNTCEIEYDCTDPKDYAAARRLHRRWLAAPVA